MDSVMQGNATQNQMPLGGQVPQQGQGHPQAVPPVGAMMQPHPTSGTTVPQQPGQGGTKVLGPRPPQQGLQGMTSQGHTAAAAHMPPTPGVIHIPPGQQTFMAAGMGDLNGVTQQHPQQQLGGASSALQQLANTKEKTPMCLVNELARFNKIPHQYTLTDEQGPAHKKTFFVKLKLGEEEYKSEGPSIKKAQHAAAQIALEKSEYKHPPPKPPRNQANGYAAWNNSMNANITPTVELNALAMKRGEPAVYQALEQRNPYQPHTPNFNFRGMYNQRYHYPRHPRLFYVSLKVGQREFIGEGNTRQVARHMAASKALKVLRALPLSNSTVKPAVTEGEVLAASQEGQEEDDLKSEISLVHEIALKRNMNVDFKVLKESGPPHMRTFVTQCTCGEYTTEAEGNSKKLSKKRAAEAMLEELRKLPTLPPTVSKPKKLVGTKKKNRNLIKKAEPSYGQGINPISRLIQIQQAKKEKEPVYELVAEKGLPRRREFVMQVTVGEQVCTGAGPNKKLAKRNAAEAMLQLLGYSRPAPQPTKPAIKTGGGEENSSVGGDKKVTFLEDSQAGTRQLIPGIILMPEGGSTANLPNHSPYSSGMNPGNEQQGVHQRPAVHFQPAFGDAGSKHSTQTTAAIALELLQTGVSPTAESLKKSPEHSPGGNVNQQNVTMTANPNTVRPKHQLMYLAQVLGIDVSFTDFPKGNNKSEYLSLVSLSTSPNQVWHGAGTTIEASHDAAALTGLKAIAEMGLDKVTSPDTKEGDRPASGDGPHIITEPMEKRANSSDGTQVMLKPEPSN